jgi:hypothetical protein
MNRMVPIQGGRLEQDGPRLEASQIPEWLAREAYAEYARHYADPGDGGFEEHHRRAGFGPMELLDLIAGGHGNGAAYRRLRETRDKEPEELRTLALHQAMNFAAQITDDKEWTERLTLVILRAARYFQDHGVRPRDLEQATMALTEKK